MEVTVIQKNLEMRTVYMLPLFRFLMSSLITILLPHRLIAGVCYAEYLFEQTVFIITMMHTQYDPTIQCWCIDRFFLKH